MRGIGDPEAGWEGAHSVPYALSLDGDPLVATPHPDLDKYRTRAPAGYVAGLAADLTWTPDDAGLSIKSGGHAVVSLSRGNDTAVTVTVGENDWQLPYSGDVRLILDGPVLEVSSTGGLFGSPISPQGTTLTLRGTDVETSGHALSR